jgi:alkylmercury lyase-like protein
MDEARFRQFLADTGPAMAGRTQRVAVPLRTLYRQILQHFAGAGDAPAPGMVAGWAACAGVETAEALAALVKADLAEADPDAGRILGAYPFSAAPRGHRVAIAGGPDVQAYCALDALGIPAMIGRDADITSRDPQSGAEIRVQVRAGRATWTPAGAVVTYPAGEFALLVTGGNVEPAAQACCPTVSFYASAAGAAAYQRAHGLDLEILTIPQALRFGSAIFGHLLAPRRGTRVNAAP